ncbi:hypothetical protein GCM10009096_18080 [Parasphingorhabdus litoris]|uniref:DUF4282 domain-containing protein n=1 Tax=Parasphingorhabdus litoris TaxID=394733 RepID=A0ABP3KD12_9SPHN|nr:DUF6768 family protein [Parasphingorhabdus litoris]
MTKFDDDLGARLSADDKAFLQDLENGRGLFDQLGATLQGPMRFWTYLAAIYAFAFFFLVIFCGWQAIEAEALRETILWSAGCVLAFVALGLLKMWIFDRMSTLSLLGEMKKIELRLARLEDDQR